MLRLLDAVSGREVMPTRNEGRCVGAEMPVDRAAWAVVADTLRRVGERRRLALSFLSTDAASVPLLNARLLPIDDGPADVTLHVALEFDGSVDDVVSAGADPLALRLGFLSAHYRTRRSWTPADLVPYQQQLQGWRDLVAAWAESPSKPMCAEYVARVVDALDDDLDSPTALDVLQELADDAVIPPGSKFETFAHLDELLGLDLARDVGRRPPGSAAG